MRNRHPFWQNSACKRGYLHRFSIKEEYPQGVKEVCEICKLGKFFKVIDGKVSNAEYMSYHLRQALPPFHPNYYLEYKFNPLANTLISPYV